MVLKSIVSAICTCCAVISFNANASFIQMDTTLGVIEIELFDNAAPITVSNFMNYVNDGDYNDSFFHRSVPGFVLQGGGFQFLDGVYSPLPTDAPIVNEFDSSYSNIRGTLAMATVSGDPNSATSQWFFNLSDNSANLDFQNGGFTVFGQVTGNGMDIIDAISALPRYNLIDVDPALTDVPLNNYSGTYDAANQLVFINNISSVPVPAAVWLFGSGLIGLIAVARRKV